MGGHTYGTCVEVAFAHHDAAERDEWGSGKAVFFGTEAGGDDDVTTGLKCVWE